MGEMLHVRQLGLIVNGRTRFERREGTTCSSETRTSGDAEWRITKSVMYSSILGPSTMYGSKSGSNNV